MIVIRRLTALALIILFWSCNNQKDTSIPAIMQPEWSGIETDNLPVKFGQILNFDTKTSNISAVVIDFNSDEAGVWIGLCFSSNNQLFGRQIPNAMNNMACLDLLDLTYIRIDGLSGYSVSGHLSLDKNKIGIGSQRAEKDLSGIEESFNHGLAQRKKKQTPCNQGLYDENVVRECYFNLSKILK